jgi:signal transduction histidine kinase
MKKEQARVDDAQIERRTAARGWSARGPQRLPIRLKVAAALAVPLVGLIVVSLVEVRRASQDLSEVRAEADLATAITGPAGIITAIQNERTWTSLELTDLTDTGGIPVEGYDENRANTDAAVEAFRDDVEAKGGAVEETFGEAVTALEELDRIRQDVDGFDEPRRIENMPFSNEVYGRFTDLVDLLLDTSSRVVGQVEDTELRRGVELAVMATTQVELEASLGRETATSAMMSEGGIDTTDEITRISALLSAFSRRNHLIQSSRGHYAPIIEEHFPASLVQGHTGVVEDAIATGSLDFDRYLETVGVRPEDDFPGLRDAVTREVVDLSEVLTADAQARQRTFMLLAVLAFAVAATVAWLVSRAITTPMRSLTRQARELAEERLPTAVRDILDTPAGQDLRLTQLEPLEATTRDEVADVVDALNTVQERALELAVEQAVLRRNVSDSFVNLARRNQSLLDRQIEFITQLESREADADALSGLFRLDHLATRMRRNAESLLVLAGSPTPRKRTAPVRVGDVIRATLGEVEDYHRVVLEHVEPAVLHGPVASDLAHLMAELVENALTFSPPDEQVMILGRWAGRDAYRVTIVDQGLGMTPHEVAQANVRLAGSESLTVAPSRYLGQHVAGTLAARHGIRVRLEAGAFKGVVATVDLAAPLVEPVTAEASLVLGAGGEAAAAHAS